MTDFVAEAREAAKRIPDPPSRPCADVLRFPQSDAERELIEVRKKQRRSRDWLRRYTRPFPDIPA